MKATDAQRLLDREEARWRAVQDRLLGDHLSDTSESEWVGEVGNVGQHPADLASETLEREIEIGLLAEARAMLVEVDAARQRVKSGTYGFCQTCGRQLPAARLDAVPATRYCVVHEELLEHEVRRPLEDIEPARTHRRADAQQNTTSG